jgi:hypothetical protein
MQNLRRDHYELGSKLASANASQPHSPNSLRQSDRESDKEPGIRVLALTQQCLPVAPYRRLAPAPYLPELDTNSRVELPCFATINRR